MERERGGEEKKKKVELGKAEYITTKEIERFMTYPIENAKRRKNEGRQSQVKAIYQTKDIV